MPASWPVSRCHICSLCPSVAVDTATRSRCCFLVLSRLSRIDSFLHLIHIFMHSSIYAFLYISSFHHVYIHSRPVNYNIVSYKRKSFIVAQKYAVPCHSVQCNSIHAFRHQANVDTWTPIHNEATRGPKDQRLCIVEEHHGCVGKYTGKEITGGMHGMRSKGRGGRLSGNTH